MKHIDGDAFARRCEEKAEEMSTTIGKAVFLAIARAVEETPESVVRCKDCRLSSIECKTKGCVGGVWKTDDKHLFCKITKHLMRVDDFCSWGERREDGKTD